MKQPMFMWRDKVANRFSAPMMFTNQASAIRDFEMRVKDEDVLMKFSPADFDLFYAGEFDNESGKFEPVLPEFVVNGASLL